jgi:hypothetical protein
MRFHANLPCSISAARIAVCVVLCAVSSLQAMGSDRNHEEYFMSRARYAANVVCTKKPQKNNFKSCYGLQMGAAKRIVARNRSAQSERMLKKTMECLQTVQMLPVKLRRKGLLWVENCIR